MNKLAKILITNRTLALVFLCLPVSAHAGPGVSLLQAMDNCSAITDEQHRLSCFDALSVQVKHALITETAGAHAPGEQSTQQEFGSEYLPNLSAESDRQLNGPIDSITANVSDYALNPFGKFVVFLENGQVWKQIGGEASVANFKKSGGNSVLISRGALGSYNLQINGSNRSFKVQRMK